MFHSLPLCRQTNPPPPSSSSLSVVKLPLELSPSHLTVLHPAGRSVGSPAASVSPPSSCSLTPLSLLGSRKARTWSWPWRGRGWGGCFFSELIGAVVCFLHFHHSSRKQSVSTWRHKCCVIVPRSRCMSVLWQHQYDPVAISSALIHMHVWAGHHGCRSLRVSPLTCFNWPSPLLEPVSSPPLRPESPAFSGDDAPRRSEPVGLSHGRPLSHVDAGMSQFLSRTVGRVRITAVPVFSPHLLEL